LKPKEGGGVVRRGGSGRNGGRAGGAAEAGANGTGDEASVAAASGIGAGPSWRGTAKTVSWRASLGSALMEGGCIADG